MKRFFSLVLALALASLPIPARGIQKGLDISCDHYGNVFVLNKTTQQIHKFDKNLNFEKTVLDSVAMNMTDVTSVTVCWCAGEISVASDSNGKSKLFEIDAKYNYKFHRDIASLGSGKGQVINPNDIVYLRSDNYYWLALTDSSLKKVMVVDDYGKFNMEIVGLVNPIVSYYSTTKQLYVLDDNKVKIFSTSGKLLKSFGSGVLKKPITIDANGTEDKIFVLDDGIIKAFNSTGSLIGQTQKISNAMGMCVSTEQNWIVVITDNEGGSFYAYSTDTLQLRKKNTGIATPKKQTVLIFTEGSYVYKINGENKKIRCPVQNVNGRTLVPLREIAEPLGGKVTWISDQKKIIIEYSNPKRIELVIGSPYAIVDGKKVMMPSGVSPAIYCDNVTLVPVRFVSENLGAIVTYENKVIEVKK